MVFWYFRTMLRLEIRPSLELRATDTILQQQAPLGKCFLKWSQGCLEAPLREASAARAAYLKPRYRKLTQACGAKTGSPAHGHGHVSRWALSATQKLYWGSARLPTKLELR